MKRFILSILTIMAIANVNAADKVLVAYFSATGTTKAVAEQIALASDGELMEIAPVRPYTSANLNWQDKKSRSTIEMNDESARPATKLSPLPPRAEAALQVAPKPYARPTPPCISRTANC